MTVFMPKALRGPARRFAALSSWGRMRSPAFPVLHWLQPLQRTDVCSRAALEHFKA